jgi:hypothetical protein
MKSFALALPCLAAVLCGCSTPVKYAPFGAWDDHTRQLGLVKASSGPWPLSIKVPPPEYTYYSALRKNAAQLYRVAETNVVLGEVTVNFASELDGTIRAWDAEALAGEKQSATNALPAAPQPNP